MVLHNLIKDSPRPSPGDLVEREVFLALMWASARPGEVRSFSCGEENVRLNPDLRGHACVGKALLDLETSFYTPHLQLRQALLISGARLLGPEKAAYHFYPEIDEEILAQIAMAPLGNRLYPETAATLVLSARLGRGVRLEIKGPGVKGSRQLEVEGIPPTLWALRNDRWDFPLGWDLFLLECQGDVCRVVGIPRSSRVEVVG